MLMLLAFLVCPFFQKAWVETIDPDGGFRVMTPCEMQSHVQPQSTVLGALMYHTWWCQGEEDDPNTLYMVSWCEYPPGSLDGDSLDIRSELLQVTMEAATDNLRGTLMYAADAELEGHPGKQWRIDYNDGQAVMKSKAFFIGDRFLLIQVAASRERHLNPEADRFFDSLRLLDK
ncbi:MAG: hypothetical protein KatS3mg029_0508 [Saprospiraceae bacterium]|nr:MAG: hypothetical protein KatS3mg029_0508 [Saprospiraceae bacterium]